MREPKPHVVSFLASLLLLAGVSTVVDRPDTTETVAITVDPVTSPEDGGTAGAGTGEQPTTTDQGTVTDGTATDGTTATSPTGGSSAPTAGSAGAGQGASGATGSTGSAGSAGSSGSTGSTGSTGGAPAAPPSGQAPTYPEAPLYDDEAKLRGFTADEITVCGHAALALGAAFNISAADLNVYWDMVNDAGGIHGRSMDLTWEDDKYVGSEAVRAAEACQGKDPFMILGGIGFDQIPGVRDWAEANTELYLHHIAIAPTQTYNYSFSLSPTVEHIGREFGNYLVANHADRSMGIIYRDTANWNPGAFAGMEVLDANGIEHRDHAIFQNQGVYSAQLTDLQTNGVEVVWLWENALNAAQVINQADEAGYHPLWVVFPFQTTIDLLNDPTAQPIEGVASWSSYAPGGYGGAFPEFGFDAEIARFEAAYEKYRPGVPPNDLLWQVWLGNKVLHRMFNDCGADCNRNRFAGMMLSGYRARELPGCQIDFSDPRSFGGHHGNFKFFAQRLFQPPSGAAYETTQYCVDSLA